MPHLTLEYSAGIAGFDGGGALAGLNEAMLASGLFAEADIKSRAVEYAVFRIGRASGQRRFVHVRAALLSGRTAEQKRALAAALLAALRAVCPAPAEGEVQLSVETVDMDRPSYAKEVLRGA